jgi:hypothetical protein
LVIGPLLQLQAVRPLEGRGDDLPRLGSYKPIISTPSGQKK